jgi:hypothetical protein
MKKPLFCILALCMATTAYASENWSATAGGMAIYREGADATFALDFNGCYKLTRNLVLDIGYAAAGEGAVESYGRLGLHYVVYRFGQLDIEDADVGIIIGGGGTVKAFGVENSDLGAYFAAGVDFTAPVIGEWLAEYEIDSGIDWPPTPTGKIKVAKVLRF